METTEDEGIDLHFESRLVKCTVMSEKLQLWCSEVSIRPVASSRGRWSDPVQPENFQSLLYFNYNVNFAE